MNPVLRSTLFVACGALSSCSERPDNAPPPAPTISTQTAPGTAAPATSPSSVPASYKASLDDGITFNKPGYPEFVSRTEGISQTEAFGRWTDGPNALIVFKEPLPKKFELVIKGAGYGPNVGQPVKITVGSVTQQMVFASDHNREPETKRMNFTLDEPADRIEFTIPQPTQPTNGDVRKLGIALVELKIEAIK